MQEERVADPHTTQGARRQVRHRRRRASVRKSSFDTPSSPFLQITAHVFLTYKRADVVDRRQVAEAARKDRLRAVVGQHVVGVLSVSLVELGLRLPHRDELDPRSSGSLGSSRSKSG